MLSEMNQTQKHTYDFTYMRQLIWINTQGHKAEQVLWVNNSKTALGMAGKEKIEAKIGRKSRN